MKNFILLLTFAFVSTNTFADTIIERLQAGQSTSFVDQWGNTVKVNCIGDQTPIEYKCTADCIAGNNQYYNTKVESYFRRRGHGVHERLLQLCLMAMPNEDQRRGARILNVKCE